MSGLDPAEGRWTFNNTDTRLDITDAEFVDIVHTNGGDFSNGEIAFIEPIGHVDFYVTALNGERVPSSGNQLSHPGKSLQLPYIHRGLGRTNNYV